MADAGGSDDDEDAPSLKEIKLSAPLLKKSRVRECLRWWPLFKACAVQKGFLPVIAKDKHPELPAEEQTHDANGKPDKMKFSAEEKQKTALTMNEMGIAAFTLAFKDNKSDDCISYVNATMTKAWPSGECWLVVVELLDEFAPDDSMGKLEQRQASERISMKRSDDPKTLFSQMVAIENRFRDRVTPLSEEEKMCTVILRAPEQHQAIIHNTRQMMKMDKKREPTLKELRKAMFDCFRVSKFTQKTNRKELTLFVRDDDDDSSTDQPKKAPKGKRKPRTNKKKKKKCYHCGSDKHVKRDCPQLKLAKKQTCGHCGKKGHTEDQCWDKHPERIPEWAKKKHGIGNDDKDKSEAGEVAGFMADGESLFSSVDSAEETDYDPFDDCETLLGQQSPERDSASWKDFEPTNPPQENLAVRNNPGTRADSTADMETTRNKQRIMDRSRWNDMSPGRTGFNDVRTFNKHQTPMIDDAHGTEADPQPDLKTGHTPRECPLESKSKMMVNADTNPTRHCLDGTKQTESKTSKRRSTFEVEQNVEEVKRDIEQQKTEENNEEESEMMLMHVPMEPEGQRARNNDGKPPCCSRSRDKGSCVPKRRMNEHAATRRCAANSRRRINEIQTAKPTTNTHNSAGTSDSNKICRESARIVAGTRQRPEQWQKRSHFDAHGFGKPMCSAPIRSFQRVDRNGWCRAPTETYARNGEIVVFNAHIAVDKHDPVGSFRRKFETTNRTAKHSNLRRCRSPHDQRERARHERKKTTRPMHVNWRRKSKFCATKRDCALQHGKCSGDACERETLRNTHDVRKANTVKRRNDHEIPLTQIETTLSQASGANMLHSPDYWVGDTGASCHCANGTAGGTPVQNSNERLREIKDALDASGNPMKTKVIMSIKGTVCNNDGQKQNVQMKDVRHGASKFNLCSLTKMTDDGWKMTVDETGICLRKEGDVIHFDTPMHTAEGRMWAVKILRRSQDNGANEMTLATPAIMNLERAHAFCGHSDLRETKRTAKHLGWRTTRTPFMKCKACAIGKAKQTDLGKGETNPPTEIGELWCIDGMKLKRPKRKRVHFPSNNCSELAVEHLTGSVMVGWHRSKSAFVDPFCSEFHALHAQHGKTVKRIRCDDAGENKTFEQTINGKNWKMAINMECTAKTPQANSRAETKIFHLCNETRAMLEAANVPELWRHALFAQFLRCCAQTDMLTVVTANGVARTGFEHLVGRLPRWTRHVQVAGMAGVVKTHASMTAKVVGRGKTCLFAGCATDHAHDCYVMYDPQTKSALRSRDVHWLNRMHFPARARVPQPLADGPISVATEEGSDDEETESIGSSAAASTSVDPDDEMFESESETDDSEMDGQVTDDSDESTDSSGDECEEEPAESNAKATNERPIKHVTRSGRAARAPVMHDGTERSLAHAETIAASIEDDCIDSTCQPGMEEACRISHPCGNAELREEECMLFSPTTAEKPHSSVERAFGCVDENGEHRLAAATLEDEEGELFLVGAAGHDCGNTAESNVMTCKQAMAAVDKKEWEKAVKAECEKMKKCNVFKVVHRRDVPKGAKPFDSAWAMKKKADGAFRARNAMRGFMQADGEHCDSHDKSSPVATEIAMKIMFAITITATWCQHLVDVEGALLSGVFQQPEKHKICVKAPEACKRWCPSWAAPSLMKTQCGAIQAALQHCRECCEASEFLKFKRNEAEPCLFCKWKAGKLIVFPLWVDDCCVCGPRDLAEQTIEEFTSPWDCKNAGELKECVGCKVDRTPKWMRLAQPAKVRRFMDEFGCEGDDGPSNRAPSTPAEPGGALEFDEDKEPAISASKQTKCRSGVGVLLHMMRWSRPDALSAVRELSSFMQKAGEQCLKALNRVMNFIASTKDRGLVFRPKSPGKWDGKRGTCAFTVKGKCDSECAERSSRRSVNAGITHSEDAIVKQFSEMMPIVALSTTEAELHSAVLTAQDVMFVHHAMESMGLKVKLPMMLHCDNKGAVDLANNWSVGGRTRHTGTKMNFPRELEERNILRAEWMTGSNITPDMHAESVTEKLFDQHSQELVGQTDRTREVC